MKLIGYFFLALGGVILFFAAFIGIEGGIGNLPGSLLGSAFFVSGAIFVAADSIIEEVRRLGGADAKQSSDADFESMSFQGRAELGDESYKLFFGEGKWDLQVGLV